MFSFFLYFFKSGNTKNFAAPVKYFCVSKLLIETVSQNSSLFLLRHHLCVWQLQLPLFHPIGVASLSRRDGRNSDWRKGALFVPCARLLRLHR